MNIVKKGLLCYYFRMILFFVKKAFIDGWDNLLHILALNVAILGLAVGGYWAAGALSAIVPLSMGIIAVTAVAEGILLVAVSRAMAGVASFKAFSWRVVFAAIRETWLHGVLYALVIVAFVAVIGVALPFYFRLGGALGITLAMILFWAAVIFVLSFQWFLPIRSQLDARFGKCVKKCFVIFFDNPGFSAFMFVYSVLLISLSCLMILLLPGIAGLVLAQNEAFRLRMHKYDWLEEHPEIDPKVARKSIPWSELIAEDYDNLGHRSLRSFIMPWKD